MVAHVAQSIFRSNSGAPVGAADVIAAFNDAIRQHGIIPPPDFISDGRLRRCKVEGGRPSKQHGTYAFHLDEQPMVAQAEVQVAPQR
jgi:hypothetical protein